MGNFVLHDSSFDACLSGAIDRQKLEHRMPENFRSPATRSRSCSNFRKKSNSLCRCSATIAAGARATKLSLESFFEPFQVLFRVSRSLWRAFPFPRKGQQTLQRNENLTQRRHRDGKTPTWNKVRVDFERVCVYQSRKHAEIRRKGRL